MAVTGPEGEPLLRFLKNPIPDGSTLRPCHISSRQRGLDSVGGCRPRETHIATEMAKVVVVASCNPVSGAWSVPLQERGHADATPPPRRA